MHVTHVALVREELEPKEIQSMPGGEPTEATMRLPETALEVMSEQRQDGVGRG